MSVRKRFIEAIGSPRLQDACEAAVNRYVPRTQGPVAPVKVEAVAEQLGMKIERRPIDSYDGRLDWDDEERAVIVVSSRSSERRQRFTIAHEIGHWIVQEALGRERHGSLFRGVSSTRKQVREEEQLVNLIAAEILMPADSVRKLLASADSVSLAGVRKVASSFCVSRTAALRRIGDLLRTPLIFLSVVPTYFDDPDSIAQVDDAIFIRPGKGSFFDRAGTRLLDKVAFRSLQSDAQHHLSVSCADGTIQGVFEAEQFRRPIPNCDLLAVMG